MLNREKLPISSLSGILGFTVFISLTLVSISLYPTTYNPAYDWLSNLGNVNLNLQGADFFNYGCIITGIILIPFFLGLYQWKPISKWRQVPLFFGVLLGVFSSISLMVGLYPETYIELHIIAAAGVFGSLFLVIILINMALYHHPQFKRGIAYYALIVVAVDLYFKYIFSQNKYILAVLNPSKPIPALERASVFLSLGWVLLLAYNMLSLNFNEEEHHN